MTKTEMYELAKVGMRERIKVEEQTLSMWYREFPDLFTGPPLLLKPELRNGSSNGLHSTTITTPPTTLPDSKASRVLPYILAAPGPVRALDILAALSMKSHGSLSTILRRHVEAGTIRRISKGLYAATDAGAAAAEPHKTKKKGKKKPSGSLAEKVRQHRARSAELLAALDDNPMKADALAEKGYKVNQHIGPLLRRGYIVKLANGDYKRTKKAFIVDTRKSAQA